MAADPAEAEEETIVAGIPIGKCSEEGAMGPKRIHMSCGR